MPRGRDPRAVRRLMPDKQAPGLALLLLVEPGEGAVGEQVGGIALGLHVTVGGVQQRVNVRALVVKRLPVVKTLRVMDTTMAHVPLAEERGGIPGLVQHGGESRLTRVDRGVQGGHTVDVAVRASQDRGPGRRAQRVGHQSPLEADALLGDPIDIRRSVEPAAVAADGGRRMVVRQEEQDVRSLVSHGRIHLLVLLVTLYFWSRARSAWPCRRLGVARNSLGGHAGARPPCFRRTSASVHTTSAMRRSSASWLVSRHRRA